MELTFWRLESPHIQRKLAWWDDDKMDLESVDYPCGHRGGGKRLTDLRIILKHEDLDDFVWTWYSECLIQDHTLRLLRDCGFTGFEVKPVAARFEKSATKPPILWELVLMGWAGVAPPESGIVLNEEESCRTCGHLVYTGIKDSSKLIKQEQWDGSDFFMVWPLPTHVFVTQRVADAIRHHGLTGVRITPVSEIKQDPRVIEGYSPGRLSHSMPEKRARELGEPLGIY